MRKLRPVLLAALMAACSACPAQYTVKNLVFRGDSRYTQEQLAKSTGLTPGDHIGTKQMGDAAQKLMDTGMFADIETTLNGPANGIDVVFTVKPGDPAELLPVSFENLVWLDPAERDAELHRRIPLYTNRLPAAGTIQVQVQAALQEMLTAKGVKADVETLQRPSTSTRPTPAIAYRVASPAVLLHDVRLANVSPALSARETAAVRRLLGDRYDEGIDEHLTDKLLQPYRDDGFLDAQLNDLKRTPVISADGTVQVSLSAAVTAGEPYHVSEFEWAGSDVVSASEFRKQSSLKAGDLASETALRKSYQILLDAYLQRGYVDVSIDPQPQRDPSTYQVAYHLKVRPGELYRVGTLRVRGLSPKAQQEFDSAWRLKQGVVYDSIYAANFLQMNTALRSLQPYTGKVDTVAHPETHTIDVELTFTANNKG